ncbi:hypothetical protein QBC39DRAFT_136851 [Podospora conica]|nr:hypothetical protein QBC39DRAFT_136851 [Schizothecium conicum]
MHIPSTASSDAASVTPDVLGPTNPTHLAAFPLQQRVRTIAAQLAEVMAIPNEEIPAEVSEMRKVYHKVKYTYFRRLLSTIDAVFVNEVMPRSHTTIASWIDEKYNEYVDFLKQELSSAKSKIHLSFDLWTSPIATGLMAIVAYYLTETGQLKFRLLALPRLEGAHSGENMAATILTTLAAFDIGEVGYLVSDNVESNRTCAAAILRQQHPYLSPHEYENLTNNRRLRCFNHILNLAAKVVFEGKDGEVFAVMDPFFAA